MSWYRDDDGKIITDEEFQDDCCNCSAFCSEGTITVPCNGERTECPYFKEVDTSEYDKEIRTKAIDEFAEKLVAASEFYSPGGYMLPIVKVGIIAEQMKGEEYGRD